ncbi:conserved hypothetical protein [Ricinus communis]|uniref:Uncharacterized protein n=1 Tax=Ricinus communis TaxID=3988 RepID=B9SYF7_RICCO|nr:conserved hypothetical protein [Ricinus communis]
MIKRIAMLDSLPMLLYRCRCKTAPNYHHHNRCWLLVTSPESPLFAVSFVVLAPTVVELIKPRWSNLPWMF